ncbi:transposase [Arthrobacter cavernae]
MKRWPYSFVAALEPGRTSWTAVLDAVRLRPDDDETEVTAAQVREVVTRLREAGHWMDGDPEILLVFDTVYELARLAFLLADLPVQVLGRMRSDRVLCFPAPPCRTGRPPRHGPEFRFTDRQAGPSRRSPPERTPTATAWRWPPPGPGCTRRSPTADRGCSTRARRRSWRGR